MKLRYLTLTSAFLILPGASAFAQALNPSFETTVGLTIGSWTQTGNVGFVTSAFGKTPGVGAGSKMAYMISQNASAPGITSTPQVASATLATALGTSVANLNGQLGAGHTVTTAGNAGASGGSGISQTFTVTAGSSLTFTWDFLTSEDPNLSDYHNDIGFVSVNGVITSLGRLDEHPSIAGDTSANQYVPFTGGALDGSNVETFLFETGDGTGNSGQRATDLGNNTVNAPAIGFGADKFQTFTINFAAAGSVQLGFGVLNVHSSATGTTQGLPSALLVDNLVYTAGGGGVAPEPGTFALLALGMVGGLALRRRR